MLILPGISVHSGCDSITSSAEYLKNQCQIPLWKEITDRSHRMQKQACWSSEGFPASKAYFWILSFYTKRSLPSGKSLNNCLRVDSTRHALPGASLQRFWDLRKRTQTFSGTQGVAGAAAMRNRCGLLVFWNIQYAQIVKFQQIQTSKCGSWGAQAQLQKPCCSEWCSLH